MSPALAPATCTCCHRQKYPANPQAYPMHQWTSRLNCLRKKPLSAKHFDGYIIVKESRSRERTCAVIFPEGMCKEISSSRAFGQSKSTKGALNGVYPISAWLTLMWIVLALLCTADIASIARAAATDDFTVAAMPPTLTARMGSDGVLESTTIQGLRPLAESSEKTTTTTTTAAIYTFSLEVNSSAALGSRSMLQLQPDTSYILGSKSPCSSSPETASSTPPTPETYPSSSRNSKMNPAAALELDVDTSPAFTVTQPAVQSRFEQVTGLPVIHKTVTVTVTVTACTNRTLFNITALYQSATFDTTVLNTHDLSSPSTGIPYTSLLSSSMILSPHPLSGTLAAAPSSNLTFMPPSTTTLTVTASTDLSRYRNPHSISSNGYGMAPRLGTTLSTQLPTAITTASYSNLIPEAEEGHSYPDSLTSMDHESAQTNVIPVKKLGLHSPSSIVVHATTNPPSSKPTAPKEQALTATTPTSTAEDVQRRSLPEQFGAPPANPAPTLNSPIQNVIVTVKKAAAATGAWLSGAMWRLFEETKTETGNWRGLAEADSRVGARAQSTGFRSVLL